METIRGILTQVYEKKQISDSAIAQRFAVSTVSGGTYFINAFNNCYLLEKFKTNDEVIVDFNVKENVKGGNTYKNNYLVSICHTPSNEQAIKEYEEEQIINQQRERFAMSQLLDEVENQRAIVYNMIGDKWTAAGKRYSELKTKTDEYLRHYSLNNKNSWDVMNERMAKIILEEIQ